MNLMQYRRHPWLAVVLAFVLALSQVAVAAHACQSDARGEPLPGDVRFAHSMPDCGSMPLQSEPATNLCGAHCVVDSYMHSGNPVLAPAAVLPPLLVRALPAFRGGCSTLRDAEARLPTPPPLLRYARLLI